jgi:hypothetical protein
MYLSLKRRLIIYHFHRIPLTVEYVLARFIFFTDSLRVLIEISRTLKSGSPFAPQTFIANRKRTNPSIKEKTGFHFFGVNELKELLNKAGFYDILIKEVETVLYSSSKRK